MFISIYRELSEYLLARERAAPETWHVQDGMERCLLAS